MENSSLTHASMLNCYTIFLKQIIPWNALTSRIIYEHICIYSSYRPICMYAVFLAPDITVGETEGAFFFIFFCL